MLDLSKDIETIIKVNQKIKMPNGMLVTTLRQFDEYPRAYHSSDHIIDLFKRILNGGHSMDEEKLLLITALFHDFVYDPKSQDNEARSAQAFSNYRDTVDLTGYSSAEGSTSGNFNLIYNTIIDTKDHIPRTGFSEIFCRYDLASFGEDNRTLIQNEMNIRKEYAWVDWGDYVTGKLSFLHKYKENPIVKNNRNILSGVEYMIEYIRNEKTPNIGIYAGSFNPMHVGHLNIIRQAEKIFDKVVIARGINPDKVFFEDSQFPRVLKYHQTETYTTSIVEYFYSKVYEPTLIRGIRNITDLQNEINQLRWMQKLNKDIKVINIICDKEYEEISSSAIRATEQFPDLKRLAESYKL